MEERDTTQPETETETTQNNVNEEVQDKSQKPEKDSETLKGEQKVKEETTATIEEHPNKNTDQGETPKLEAPEETPITESEAKKSKSANSKKDKLKYLEEKYKDLFKDNASKKDEITRLKSILQDVQAILQPNNPMVSQDWENDKKVEAWLTKLSEKNEEELEAKKNSELKEEQQETGSPGMNDIAKQLKDSSKRIDELQQKVKELTHSLEDRRKDCSRLQRDNSDLLRIVKLKDDEIKDLKSITEQLSNTQDDPLLQRFSDLEESSKQKKPSEDVHMVEISRLRHELDEAYSKIDTLEDQVSALSKKLGGNKSISPEGSIGETHSKEVQTEEADFNSKLKPVESLDGFLERKSKSREIVEDDDASRNYLKNLVIRYMIYEAKKNEEECTIIRRAILDYLKVGSQDRATIDDAINNRGGIKDAVYFLKIFGNQ